MQKKRGGHKAEGINKPLRTFRTADLKVEEYREEIARGAAVSTYVILRTDAWVNVVALTTDKHLVLVRQHRYGAGATTTELPAGSVQQQEPESQAAARELREETGFAGDEPELLGYYFPNPALQDNRCSAWLIQNARRTAAPCPDIGEELEVLTVPLRDVLDGTFSDINNGLSLTALFLFQVRRPRVSTG